MHSHNDLIQPPKPNVDYGELARRERDQRYSLPTPAKLCRVPSTTTPR